MQLYVAIQQYEREREIERERESVCVYVGVKIEYNHLLIRVGIFGL